MSYLLAQLAFSLCGLLGLGPSRPLMNFNLWLWFVHLLLLSSQTRQKLLLAPQPRASLRPIRPQLLDGLQALASANVIILIGGISTCAIIAGSFGLSTGNNLHNYSSACSVIAFPLSPLLGASQPLYGLLLTLALTVALGASERF